MKKALIRAALLLGMPAMTYLGLVAGVDGALYVTKFFVWAICLPLGLIALTDAAQKNMAKEPDTGPLNKMAAHLVAWACLGMMIWTGHIATGMAWGFYMLCCAIASEGVKKHRTGPSAAPVA
jgi:hypothetical protein